VSGSFGWRDAELIGGKLAETEGERDPLGVTLVELRRLVEGLEGFEDEGEPDAAVLEAVQRAWLGRRV
jgi:FeS assembly protein IscX